MLIGKWPLNGLIESVRVVDCFRVSMPRVAFLIYVY